MSNNLLISKRSRIFKFSSPQPIKINPINSNHNMSLNISSKDLGNNLDKTKNNLLYDPKTKTYKSINHSYIYENKYIPAKKFELESNKKENKDIIENKNTFIIDFRYYNYKYYPVNQIVQKKKSNNEELYWFVTYDKLIKTKNILRILNYNNCNDKNKYNSINIYTESDLKITTLKIPNYELFFVKGYDRPFVKPNKNSFIFTKLYLLTKNEINKILNFINRIEDKIDIDKYLSNIKQNIYQYIDFNTNNNTNSDINYPYCYIYYLGKFMNISMLLFTNTFNYIQNYNKNNNLIYSLPSTKKLYKLIKIIIKSFPEYSPDTIINNIIKNDLYSNSIEMKNDVFKNLSLLKHSAPNKLLLNKVLRETITGIQTNSSVSVSPIPFDSIEQVKTSNIQKNSKKVQKIKQNTGELKKSIPTGYKFEFKNSFNSINNAFLNGNGQNGTNNLSTTHTILPSNSIRTYSNKNSINNNIPLITIPSELNYTKKDGLKSVTTKNIHSRKNIKLKQNVRKKINRKKLANKLRYNDDKENIDINSLLNKKKEDNNFINKLNNGIGFLKKKKIDKKNKIKNDNRNEYTTPKKRKKIKYYE